MRSAMSASSSATRMSIPAELSHGCSAGIEQERKYLVGDGADGRRRRNRQDPRPDDLGGNAPPDGGEALGGPDTDDRPGNRVGRADPDAQHRRQEDRRG